MDEAVAAAGETHPTCDGPLSQRRPPTQQSRVRLAFVFFWNRRILGLGDFCLRSCFWSKCSDPLLFSQGSAAPTLLFLWAGQGSPLADLRVGSAAFRCFSGQQASRRSQVGGRHLPTVSYGQFLGFLSVQCFWNSRMTRAIVTLGQAGSTVILAAQLSFVNFVLREKFVLMFQTFSRNDPPGKAPPSRGRSVFKKIIIKYQQHPKRVAKS